MLTAIIQLERHVEFARLTFLGRALMLAFGLVTLYAFTHRFVGLGLDGELYAVQALSRLRPNLLSDIYLQNTTQDHYTVFSPVYAFFIGKFGLLNSATLLFAVCTVWLMSASKALASRVFDPEVAWLSVAAIIIIGGVYGPFSVFSYTENYVTARSLAEAIVVTAVGLYFAGWPASSIVLAAAALVIHPIMALPGLLFVLCMTVSRRWASAAAVLGVLAAVAITLASRLISPQPEALRTISGSWYEMVLERSQFLFIQHWDRSGYEAALRAFVCLVLTSQVFTHDKLRRYCFAAILVGLAGLAVNVVGSVSSPVALLVQGQPWRWTWITTFCAILALPPTILAVLREPRVGWLCALALILGWVYSEVDGAACCLGALLMWMLRRQVTLRIQRLIRIGSLLAALIVVTEVVANAITLQGTPAMDIEREPLWVAHIREVFGLGIPAVFFIVFIWVMAPGLHRPAALTITVGLLGASAAFMLPKALRVTAQADIAGEIARFSEWRKIIPPQSSVLLYPPRKSVQFAWFTLERPSYMSVDQSSGVVFSEQTAAEIRRRSEVLLPVMDPDWRLYSLIRHGEHASKKTLTAQALTEVCTDPELGYVIAQPLLGFDPLTYRGPGVMHGWNLYDCGHIRVQANR